MNDLTPIQLKYAREWLFELSWGEDFDNESILDPERISDSQIERAIQDHFSGGIPAFVATFTGEK